MGDKSPESVCVGLHPHVLNVLGMQIFPNFLGTMPIKFHQNAGGLTSTSSCIFFSDINLCENEIDGLYSSHAETHFTLYSLWAALIRLSLAS